VGRKNCGTLRALPALSLTISGLGRLLRSGMVGGARGGSLSALGYCGRFQAESAVDYRESLSPAAVIGPAEEAPSTAPSQCGPAVLDLRQPMVQRLAKFAAYYEARNGVEVASTGLACLLVLAITSATRQQWSTAASPGASSPHPAHGCGQLAVGSKANPS
jgi:hypothetical protein